MPRDFSLQDVWAAPMAGTRHNGLPTGNAYTYRGKGFDIYDDTDPGHPDYVKPHLRKTQPRNPAPTRPAATVSLSLADRQAARRNADKARNTLRAAR